MQKHRKKIYWALILSETSHVFCCVLPTLFSVLSLLVGAGLIGALPTFMVDFHHVIHHYELPIVVASFIILGLGWALDYYAHKVDCHHTGCHHGSCAPKKYKAHKILIIATVLFVANLAIYLVLHRGMHFFH